MTGESVTGETCVTSGRYDVCVCAERVTNARCDVTNRRADYHLCGSSGQMLAASTHP